MFPTALLLCMFRSCGFSKKRLLSTITNCFLRGLLAFPIAGCFWVTPLFFSSRSLGPVPWLFFFNRVTPLFFSSRFLGPVPWLFFKSQLKHPTKWGHHGWKTASAVLSVYACVPLRSSVYVGFNSTMRTMYSLLKIRIHNGFLKTILSRSARNFLPMVP